MTDPRRIDVPAGRLQRWVTGFAERHGEPTWSVDASSYLLSAADGAWARMTAWNVPASLSPDLAAWSQSPPRLVIILIRRGGYAVGVAHGETLVTHKCGTKYVQSRTAAGGWSQQRYARRRSNQADALVEKTVEQALALRTGRAATGVVMGGDKSLSAAVLADRRLERLAKLPRREFFDIPDPRLSVLHSVADRARSVSITVSNMSA